jgi:GNAT superfamily N-acetyltransferase
METTHITSEEVASGNLEEVCATFARCFDDPVEHQEARALYESYAAGRRDFPAEIPPRTVRLEGYWLHRSSGEAVGISGLYRDCGSLWIGWFGVIESRRRQGIGTAIVSGLLAEAAQAGERTLRVFTVRDDPRPALFYRGLGFVDCESDAVDPVVFRVLEAATPAS